MGFEADALLLCNIFSKKGGFFLKRLLQMQAFSICKRGWYTCLKIPSAHNVCVLKTSNNMDTLVYYF